MTVTETALPGVLLLEPRVFRDERGWFLETWRDARYAEAGVAPRFVQDNVSVSRRGVIRGLHYQEPGAQGKLVSVLRGRVLDVAVDVRAGSPTFGRWVGYELSDENGHQLWIPEGFAHGFSVLSGEAVFAYKCTAPYVPAGERTVRWDDPDLAIDWRVADPVVSDKDREGRFLRDLPAEHLPRYPGAEPAAAGAA